MQSSCLNSLFLVSGPVWISLAAVIAGVVCLIIGFFLGKIIEKKIRNSKIGSVEQVLATMRENAENIQFLTAQFLQNTADLWLEQYDQCQESQIHHVTHNEIDSVEFENRRQ